MNKLVLGLLLAAGFAQAANAQVIYNDTVGDVFVNPGEDPYDHLDIANVVVSHDANFLYFNINLTGNADARDWGKYCVAIDAVGGANDTNNAWGANISWNGQHIDFWIGSWVDGGGGVELRGMSGANDGSNSLLAATYNGDLTVDHTWTGTSQTIKVSRALLGLTGNDTFQFDVVTTGGGGTDPGVDHLSNAAMSTPGWGTGSTAGQFLSYTIPTPGSLAFLGLSGLALTRRRR